MSGHDSSLLGLLEQMGPHEQRRILEGISALAQSYGDIATRHADDLPSVAHAIHLQVDRSNAEVLRTHPMGKDVQCRRGCNACCFLHVSIDPPEAALLAKVVVEEGIKPDYARLNRQSGISSENWTARLPDHADRRCVFNDEETGDCRVYEYRPRACRKYQVVTDPELCDISTNAKHMVGRLTGIEAEATHAAAFLAFPGEASLPDALHKALNERTE